MNITVFQKKVYEATSLIPVGQVTTYKLLAEFIECKSSQAVGQALKRNPFAPKVPCHRVITSKFMIGGFMGNRAGKNIKSKLKLLKSEGVIFKDGKLFDHRKVFSY